MGLKTISIYFIMMLTYTLAAQEIDSINQTDMNGKKQGHWIKKIPMETYCMRDISRTICPQVCLKDFSKTTRSAQF
jgi:hypothetical protein